MKEIIKRAIVYFLICSVLVYALFHILKMTNLAFEEFLPNIVTFIVQVFILGFLFDWFDRYRKYRAKIDSFNTIKAILVEPIIRFNEPDKKDVYVNEDNLEHHLLLAEKNIGTVGINHYQELLNSLDLQRHSSSGLMILASQISNFHVWHVGNLIGTLARMLEEIGKICPTPGEFQEITNTKHFNWGFNQNFRTYLHNCSLFSQSKKNIK